jgi:hypothetical protein
VKDQNCDDHSLHFDSHIIDDIDIDYEEADEWLLQRYQEILDLFNKLILGKWHSRSYNIIIYIYTHTHTHTHLKHRLYAHVSFFSLCFHLITKR